MRSLRSWNPAAASAPASDWRSNSRARPRAVCTVRVSREVVGRWARRFRDSGNPACGRLSAAAGLAGGGPFRRRTLSGGLRGSLRRAGCRAPAPPDRRGGRRCGRGAAGTCAVRRYPGDRCLRDLRALPQRRPGRHPDRPDGDGSWPPPRHRGRVDGGCARHRQLVPPAASSPCAGNCPGVHDHLGRPCARSGAGRGRRRGPADGARQPYWSDPPASAASGSSLLAHLPLDGGDELVP